MWHVIRDPEIGRQRIIAEFNLRVEACEYISDRYRRCRMMRDAVLHIDVDSLSIRRSTGEVIHYYAAVAT